MTVTEDNDGLVTPDIYSRLVRLKQFIQKTNFNFRPFKLLPGKDAYWYYFRSSDKLLKFIPESENALRIEVDKSRLYQLITKGTCQGQKGLQGAQGNRGSQGLPGPPEVCYQPVINRDRLDFAIFTPVPLLNNPDIILPNGHVPDISVRLYGITVSSQVSVKKKLISKAKTLHDQAQYMTMYYHQFDDIAKQFQEVKEQLIQQSLGSAGTVITAGTAGTSPICDIPLSPVLIIPSHSQLDSSPTITVLIDPTGANPVRITTDAQHPIDLQKSTATINYDNSTGIVCGSLFLQNELNWSNEWCVKARQRGLDGNAGSPGNASSQIVDCSLDNLNIVATCPIISVRLNCDQTSIFTTCSNLISDICVDKVQLTPTAGAVSNQNAINATFASVPMTLDDCKKITKYQVFVGSIDQGGIEPPPTTAANIEDPFLTHWEPQDGCLLQRHYATASFNWFPIAAANAACNPANIWYDENLIAQPGAFPVTIPIAPEPPPDKCCEETAFYCPNIQDGGCPPATSNTPIPPPPHQPPPPPFVPPLR